MRTLDVKRLCLIVVGLAYAVAGTAEGQSLSVAQSKPARPHAAKTTTLKAAATKSEGLGDIQFSDPYAPPVGVEKTTIARFPAIPTDPPPVAPQGGMSFTAGRDSPDAPFTGGLKFRF
jgi:hypothetical protein